MISVVVCTHNGSLRIGTCISSLVAQENPPKYEILVVDNASTDRTRDLVKAQLSSSFPLESWRIVQEKRPGLLYARLAGLKAARFDWVLFCDDDNVLFPDFLFQCQKVLSNNPRIGVLGSLGIPEFLGPKPDWFDLYSSSYAVGSQLGNEQEEKYLVYVYGACSIYKKGPLIDLFRKGFQPVLNGRKGQEMSSGDDVEWCWLMQLLGYQVAYSGKLQFYHQIPASRLTWEYYIRLKSGISGGVGLLSTYAFYFTNSYRIGVWYAFSYFSLTIKSFLLYWKYRIRWKGAPNNPKDELSFAILEAKMNSFLRYWKPAYSHFRQLKQYFGA